MIADVKHRYKLYKSDILDGLNAQCLASIIFLYFACITPIVTFGGLMSQKTGSFLVLQAYNKLPKSFVFVEMYLSRHNTLLANLPSWTLVFFSFYVLTTCGRLSWLPVIFSIPCVHYCMALKVSKTLQPTVQTLQAGHQVYRGHTVNIFY